ncbi:MAG: DUF5050 domain-containing protein [Syntrophomonas sp.]
MKYCGKCGKETGEDSRFCQSCGHALFGSQNASAVVLNHNADVDNARLGLQPHEPALDDSANWMKVSNELALSSPPKAKGIKFKVLFGAVLALILMGGGFWGWHNYGTEARVQAKLDLAVKYLSENDYEKAILAFNDAIKIDPKEVKAYQGLARVYTIQGKYDEARSTYDKGLVAVAAEKKQTLQIGLAGMYIDQGQLDKAEQAFQELANTNKNCLEAYWGLAMVYQQKGDNSKAEAILRKCIENNPNEYRAYNTLALFLKHNNKADDAFNSLVKSLSLETNQQEAYLVLSDMYKGRWNELQSKTSSISDQQAAAMLQFYGYYASGDYHKAVTNYNERLSQQTGNQKARLLAAIATLKLGDKPGAEALIKQLAKEKLNEWLLSDLAGYYMEAGDKSKAKEYALKALKANPTNLEAIALLQTIDSEDAKASIYTAQALLYNWKPVIKVKEELQAMSKTLPGDAKQPVINIPANTSDRLEYGNTVGNSINGGVACQRGEWIYFTPYSGGLCRIHPDGTGLEQISSDPSLASGMSEINVTDKWIIFSLGFHQELYRMSKDGKNLKQISSQWHAYNVNVYKDWVYYSPNYSGLYRTSIDGSATQELDASNSVQSINVADDYIYYSTDKNVYRMKLDGSNKKVIPGIRSLSFNVIGNVIYYSNISDNYKLYKAGIDGSNPQKLNDDTSTFINVSGEWVYYSIRNEDYKVYRIRTDGVGRQKLNNDQSREINVVDNWVYYTNSGDNYRLYRMHTDGSGRQAITPAP